MIQEHHISISKTVRYYSLGSLQHSTKHLWIGLHGYGQLARFFIKKLETLADHETAVVAPEGLHRFYLEGTSGSVGASWMTSEARLDDIEDQYNYLSSLILLLKSQTNPAIKIHLLGFSQGVATLLRYVVKANTLPASIILWAGTPPDDIDYYQLKKNDAGNSRILVVCGQHDPYFTGENSQVLTHPLTKNHIPFDFYEFDGGHDLETATLQIIKKTIDLSGE